MQEPNEASTAAHRSCLPSSKQQALSLPSGCENPAAHGKSLADHSVQAGTVKKRRTFSSGSMSGAGDSSTLGIIIRSSRSSGLKILLGPAGLLLPASPAQQATLPPSPAQQATLPPSPAQQATLPVQQATLPPLPDF